MKIKLLLAFLIFIAIGCTAPSSKTVVLEEAQGGLVLLPDSSLTDFSCLSFLKDGVSGTIIDLFDVERHSELFFDEKGKELLHVPLHFPDSLSAKDPLLFVQALNTDSILALWPSMKTIFLFDGKGNLIKQFDASIALKDGQTNYSLVAMNTSPMTYDGKNIFVTCTRLDVVLRTRDARKIYFSTPSDISINLQQPNEQKNTGVWPADYRSGDSYRDFYPQRCVNGKGEIVYGFTASDSLFVMKDNKLVAGHFCKSDFMTERHPFPDDSVGHFAYLNQYVITEPRYITLVYDPYRNYYYRIVFHATTYEKPDGMTVTTYPDKPWSLMILDENFNLVNEIRMDNTRFIPLLIPVKDGLLFKKRQEKNALPPISFSLFKFKP